MLMITFSLLHKVLGTLDQNVSAAVYATWGVKQEELEVLALSQSFDHK